VQLSVDGFVARPDGALDWMTWTLDDKLKQFIHSLTDSSDTILLGRKMTDGFVSHWENVVNNAVIINFHDSSVHTYGQAPIDAILFAVMKNYQEKDGNKILVFAGVDRIDTKCVVVFKTYKNPDSIGFEASFDFSWPETDIAFGLKK
jgi:dihydrofolate reductase